MRASSPAGNSSAKMHIPIELFAPLWCRFLPNPQGGAKTLCTVHKFYMRSLFIVYTCQKFLSLILSSFCTIMSAFVCAICLDFCKKCAILKAQSNERMIQNDRQKHFCFGDGSDPHHRLEEDVLLAQSARSPRVERQHQPALIGAPKPQNDSASVFTGALFAYSVQKVLHKKTCSMGKWNCQEMCSRKTP